MYWRMDGFIDRSMDLLIDGWIFLWTDGFIEGCNDLLMYFWINGFIHWRIDVLMDGYIDWKMDGFIDEWMDILMDWQCFDGWLDLLIKWFFCICVIGGASDPFFLLWWFDGCMNLLMGWSKYLWKDWFIYEWIVYFYMDGFVDELIVLLMVGLIYWLIDGFINGWTDS